MTNLISISGRRFQGVLSSLLLVVLLGSANASTVSRCQAKMTEDGFGNRAEWLPGPNSIRSTESLRHNPALTTLFGQRFAVDISKQNRVKNPLIYSGLSRREFGVPAAIVRLRLVVTDQSVLYLSFRLSRPGGRAPPLPLNPKLKD